MTTLLNRDKLVKMSDYYEQILPYSVIKTKFKMQVPTMLKHQLIEKVEGGYKILVSPDNIDQFIEKSERDWYNHPWKTQNRKWIEQVRKRNLKKIQNQNESA